MDALDLIHGSLVQWNQMVLIFLYVKFEIIFILANLSLKRTWLSTNTRVKRIEMAGPELFIITKFDSILLRIKVQVYKKTYQTKDQASFSKLSHLI